MTIFHVATANASLYRFRMGFKDGAPTKGKSRKRSLDINHLY